MRHKNFDEIKHLPHEFKLIEHHNPNIFRWFESNGVWYPDVIEYSAKKWDAKIKIQQAKIRAAHHKALSDILDIFLDNVLGETNIQCSTDEVVKELLEYYYTGWQAEYEMERQQFEQRP